MNPRPAGHPRLLAFVALALSSVTLVLAQSGGASSRRKPPATAEGPPSHELVLHKWSGTLNVPDPVACTVDPQSRVYVSATTRRKVGDLDIREHTMWIPDDVSFTSVADKAAFYHRELAPGKMRAPRGGLRDHNKDGSVDWRDLTAHTERIYQLRDTDGDGTADRMTVFAEGFNTEVTGIAAGVLYHDGWVYATIAPDLWRFKDTDDDGVADVREVIAHGFGIHIAYAGHDMHGLTVGPDGRIYWSIGDKGANVVSKEGRRFYFPNEGAIFRIEPDGSNFEVYAHGCRNVQEPAFNEFGDLIGVDNDADQPGERERFVHILEASDSGWRCNYQYMREDSPWMREGLWKPKFPGQAAYLLPPLASYSDGPAGFKHDPGTALSDRQRGVFLLNEFPSGKMKGFRTERDGATFRMVDARIINDGVMGIGMSWHPDGSLMMVDWVGGYPLDEIGALWRVDAKGGADNPRRRETHQLLASGFAQRGDAELTRLLAHADQRVRQGAQLELARRGKRDELLAVLRAPAGNQLARIHALWGIGQLLRRDAADAMAITPFLRDEDPELRAQTAKVLGDAATTGAKEQGRALIPLLSDAEPRTRVQAAIALGKFREPAAVEALFAMAERDAAVPVLRHAVVTGLTGCATPDQLAARKMHPSVAVRLAAIVALRRLGSAAAAEFLADEDVLVVQEAARAIHDDLSIPAALPALAATLGRRSDNEIITRRAINAGLRLGTPEAAERLLAFTLDGRAPLGLRGEALATLRVWRQPPRLDLVDGRARTLQPARIEDVLTRRLDELLALTEPVLKAQAIELMIGHELKPGAARIAALVAEAGAPAELRAQALRLLSGAERDDPAFSRALDLALADDAPPPLHRAGLALLLPAQPERLAREAEAVLRNRSIAEQQQAIALLAAAAHPAADAILANLGERLANHRCAPELTLDVLEALRARAATNPALAAPLKRYSASGDATAHRELLTGGDPAAGRNIVANHLNANCTACHSVESGSGSEVGPNLRAIGAQRDPAYLLEALLTPSAQIAPGFGIVNVTLRDHTEVTGTLARETADAVTVRLFDGAFRTIPRAEIASQTPPVSIMPPMLGILQPREIRDVVAYLSGLKPGRGETRRQASNGD